MEEFGQKGLCCGQILKARYNKTEILLEVKMFDKYDYISTDFKGHISFEEDNYDEDISYKVDECVSDKIKSLEHELEYYNLFQDCIEIYTQFEVTNARLLDENICRVEADIKYGKEYLEGKPSGTHGKDCSTKLVSLNNELGRLLNLWKDIPYDLKVLMKFNLFEI